MQTKITFLQRFIIAGMFMLFASLVSFSQTPSRLKVSGNKIVDACGNEVMLKGMAIPDPSGLKYGFDNNFGNPSVNTTIDRALDKSKGFYANCIRMQIEPINNTQVGNQYPDIADHNTWFNNYIKPAVDYLTSKGVYVIIDLHYINNTYGNDGNGQDVDTKVKEFWNFMAPKFKDNTNVLYEVFNEPIDNGSTWAQFKSRVQPWVNIIRSAAPNTPILVGGPIYSQEIAGAANDPINDNNIIYVTHIYTFHNFTDLSNKALQVKAKYPVVLGEWGWDSNNNGYGISKNTSYPTQIKKFIDDNKISFLNWWAAGGDNFDLCLWKSDWLTLRAGSGYAGETMGTWLTQYKDSYNACTTGGSTGGGGTGTSTKYEAENGTKTGSGVSNQTSCAGYTGTGYVGGFTTSGDKLDITVNTSSAGSYTLTIHYALCNDQYNDVLVNNSLVGSASTLFSYNSTACCTWQDKALTVNLNAGNNTITIRKNWGYFSVDYITISGGTSTGGGGTFNNKYEAENATKTGSGVTNQTSCGSYTGTGYVGGFTTSGDKIDFAVNSVPSVGKYTLVIRYALCNDQNNDILVNNSLVGGATTLFGLNGKTGCCTWQDKSITVNLNAGNNTITIRKNWGYMSVDYINVASCPTCRVSAEKPIAQEINEPIGFPNPANTELTILLPEGTESEVSLNMVSATGKSVMNKNLTVNTEDTKATINVSEVPAGLYIMKVERGINNKVGKVLIVR